MKDTYFRRATVLLLFLCALIDVTRMRSCLYNGYNVTQALDLVVAFTQTTISLELKCAQTAQALARSHLGFSIKYHPTFAKTAGKQR